MSYVGPTNGINNTLGNDTLYENNTFMLNYSTENGWIFYNAANKSEYFQNNQSECPPLEFVNLHPALENVTVFWNRTPT